MDDLVARLISVLPVEVEEGLIVSTAARALRLAPCLSAADFPSIDAAVGVLQDVILRKFDRQKAKVAPGLVTSKQMGERSLSIDARSVPDVLFQPAEIAELQAMCAEFTGAAPAGLPVGTFPEAQPWPC